MYDILKTLLWVLCFLVTVVRQSQRSDGLPAGPQVHTYQNIQNILDLEHASEIFTNIDIYFFCTITPQLRRKTGIEKALPIKAVL